MSSHTTLRGIKQQITLWSYPSRAVLRTVERARTLYPHLQWVLERPPSIHFNMAPLIQALRKPVTSIGLFPIHLRFMPQLIERGWLQPLEGALTPEELDRYHPSALKYSSSKDRLYCLPEDIRPYCMVARNSLLNKVGLKLPTTWDELLDQVRFLKRRFRRPILGIQFGGYNRTLGFLLALLGSNALDPRGGVRELIEESSSGLTQSYEWIRELLKVGEVVEIVKGKSSPKGRLQSRLTQRKFLNEKGFYFFKTPGDLVRLPVEIQKDLTLLTFPHGPADGQRLTVINGSGWAIPFNTATLELSLEILHSFVSTEAAKENELEGGMAFLAQQGLWRDRELLRKRPLYRQAPRLLDGANLVIVEPRTDFLDLMETFQHAIRENESADGWLNRLKPSTIARESVLHPSVAAALQYIDTHVEELTSIGQLAQAVCVNPNYLNTLFQQHLKTSCWAYIREKRMERVKTLLSNPTLSIKEIAFRMKFTSVSSFSQVFKRHFKTGPRSMRQELIQRFELG